MSFFIMQSSKSFKTYITMIWFLKTLLHWGHGNESAAATPMEDDVAEEVDDDRVVVAVEVVPLFVESWFIIIDNDDVDDGDKDFFAVLRLRFNEGDTVYDTNEE